MVKKLIVKGNALIEASYSLDTVEQRILFLAILALRAEQTPVKAGQKIRIHASDYTNTYNVDRYSSYEAMRNGANGLYEAGFTYSKTDLETGITGVAKSRWVDNIAYYDKLGIVDLTFASEVIPLISELEKRFTQYDIAQVANLKSRYAIRLYELIIQWRGKGKTPQIELADLRNKLGILEHEYSRMVDFKARVIDTAIKQINEHTDITAKYIQHKQGRYITGFTFSFKLNNKPAKQQKAIELTDPNTIDLFNGLSDKQLERIARNKQFIADYNHLVSPNSNANKDPSEWVKAMVKRLKADPNQFNKKPLTDYLA